MSAAALIRAPQEGGSFPALDRVAQRLARGLGEYFAGFGCDADVKAGSSQIIGYADWLAAHPHSVLFPLRLGRKLNVQVALPLPSLLGMVDLFYGGAGAPGEIGDTLTSAELRFADRMGGRLAAIMGAAWSAIELVKPEAGAVALAAQASPLCRASDPVLVQHYSVSDAPFAAGDICCLYPLAALRTAIGGLSDEGAAAGETDADWSARINTAALNVRLPVRTIFARPEISFARLLSLKTGDIIPLLLPQHVPVTVAGRQFAHGTIGEANGRAAIKIEKMQEGFCP